MGYRSGYKSPSRVIGGAIRGVSKYKFGRFVNVAAMEVLLLELVGVVVRANFPSVGLRAPASHSVVALWEGVYIENKSFDLDTLRVPNRSPTPISKTNDFLRQSEDIWGARGPTSSRFWGFPGSGPA